ncbi:acyl-coenzyme A oxidase-like protein [Rhinopithecus roxellana]|uniref:acyl-coenzyme A oxidase-like protein n=1 Tax=Rhinopithecus roxellana TaxID=61622 RepID=UPI0012376AA9|nr:acyl-coenzyme A oxidase-like protein [Rhinopithecus roxellana]
MAYCQPGPKALVWGDWSRSLLLLDLCDSVKDDALRVIPAFNIPHTNLHAPIAGISNPRSAWAFYPAPLQPLPREGARSQRPKLGAKL